MPVSSRIAVAAAASSMLLIGQPVDAQVGLSDHNSNAPIEITADTLTVRQAENLAIFSGDVDAVQGDVSLKADELRVFYLNEDNGSGNGQAGPTTSQNIRRIEAEGNVLLAAPEQSASGERGVYEVQAGRVTLMGNVALSSPENIIRGGHLELDLNTGVATLNPAMPDEEGRSERVRAVFQSQGERTP
jgi:lipopolysaccharide export system protein LptA